MGAGLQQNMGKKWGLEAWEKVTDSQPNPVFTDTTNRSANTVSRNRKRKERDDVKAKRRSRKYARKEDDSTSARMAYSRHDDGISPEEATDDVSPDYLERLKSGFYQTKVIVTPEEAQEIERNTVDQADNQQWFIERRKRITASNVGSIAKMRANTKRSKKVQQLLYNSFKGNAATRYGTDRESSTRQKYVTYMKQQGHSHLNVKASGMFVSLENPWLAATPDGLVEDCTDGSSQSLGLVEIKNPYTVRKLSLSEAVKKPAFCLEENKVNTASTCTYKLKRKHDYFYQVQCQLYYTHRDWCDFVVSTELDMHVERIYRDDSWWTPCLNKLRTFYFSSLLPELACPRRHKGGIREL